MNIGNEKLNIDEKGNVTIKGKLSPTYTTICNRCNDAVYSKNPQQCFCQSCSDKIREMINNGHFDGPFKGCEKPLIPHLAPREVTR